MPKVRLIIEKCGNAVWHYGLSAGLTLNKDIYSTTQLLVQTHMDTIHVTLPLASSSRLPSINKFIRRDIVKFNACT